MITTVWTLDGWSAYGGAGIVPDSDGVEWLVAGDDGEDGWRSPAGIRSVNDDRPRADGGLSGERFRTARVIELGGTVIAPDTSALRRAMRRFAALMLDGRVLYPLVVEEDGETRFALVEPTDRPEIEATTPTDAEWHLTLRAPDHRKYDLAERTASTGLPASMGGLRVPVRVPVRITSSGSSGRLSARNAGTAPTAPTITIVGPVFEPRVDLITTGQSLRFTTDVQAGHTLTIDCARGTVLLDGTVSRRVDLRPESTSPSAVFLAPGSNELTFRARSSTGGAQMSIRWRDAYL